MTFKKTINVVSAVAVMSLPLALLFFPQSNKYDWLGPAIPFYCALMMVAVAYIAGIAVKNRQIKSPAFLLLFVGWTILSFAMSQIRSFGFTEVLVTVSSAVLFLYVSGEDMRKVFRKYLPHIIILTLLVSAFGGVFTYLNTDHTRFFGLFYNPAIKADAWPNAYATFFLLAFPFFFIVTRDLCKFNNNTGDGQWKCLLIAILTGFTFATFVLTYSRAGYIAFAIEMILLALFVRPKVCKRCIASIVVFLIFVICSTYIISNIKQWNWSTASLDGRITFNDTIGSSSYTERYEFFSGSLLLMNEQPLFGYGPMSFKWAYPHVQEGFLAISDHPHNLLLKYGVERGLPGALFFLFFLFFVFIENHPFKETASMYEKIAWAGLLGVLAHSMVDFNFNFITNEFLFWIILGTLYKGKNAKFSGGGMALTAALILLLLTSASQMQKNKELLVAPSVNDIITFNSLLPRFSLYEVYEKHNDHDEFTEAILSKQLDINGYDTLTMWRLAQYYEKEGKLEEAENIYEKALQLNPKNTFLVYLDYLKLEIQMGDTEKIEDISAIVLPLMVEYEKLYSINLHYTRSSNERVYVDELKTLLGN